MNAKLTQTMPGATAPKKAPQSEEQTRRGSKLFQTLLLPALAVLTGFIIGAIVDVIAVIITDATIPSIAVSLLVRGLTFAIIK